MLLSILADIFLSQGGVVYGARYNFTEERLEQCSSDICSMDELRKSKYIESYMGDTIKNVSENLKKGRKVMYCGTPCQVEGLLCFLSKMKIDTTNLLSVRFVCHGVPSNRFFSEYKHYEEGKHRSIMTFFDFRPKTNGWRSSDWKMMFDNGEIETGPYYYYYYYYYFQLSNLLRKSCYSCKRIFHEMADITIGDFFGIHFYNPSNKDQEGISLFLAHSDKAFKMLKAIEQKCYMEKIPNSALEYIYREAEGRKKKLTERDNIFNEVRRRGYMKVAKKKLKSKIWKRKTTDVITSKISPLLKYLRKR